MPIYDYKCTKCENDSTDMTSYEDRDRQVCKKPKCKGELVRQWRSAPTILGMDQYGRSNIT